MLEHGVRLFTETHRLRLQEGKFCLDVRTKFITIRVMQCWSRLVGEAVGPPSLEISELDMTLSTLI